MLALVGKPVLAAVQFHMQLGLLTKEIQIIITQRMLPTKFTTTESPVAQPAPHELLPPSFILAKLARACEVGPERILGNGGMFEKLVLMPALPANPKKGMFVSREPALTPTLSPRRGRGFR